MLLCNVDQLSLQDPEFVNFKHYSDCTKAGSCPYSYMLCALQIFSNYELKIGFNIPGIKPTTIRTWAEHTADQNVVSPKQIRRCCQVFETSDTLITNSLTVIYLNWQQRQSYILVDHEVTNNLSFNMGFLRLNIQLANRYTVFSMIKGIRRYQRGRQKS